ncbi:MAG: chemotaxis protein CheD [Deltaproteobacteria bacterium]|nr:chemotaxis protein CheD [Deltaproteobacteria bacterium]
MGQIIIGISDFKISNKSQDVLITYALGSCIAVVVYDPKVKVGGLLHFMLADSSIDTKKALQQPAMFADTGVPLLFKACYKLGAEKRHMTVKLAGGASIMDDTNFFRIGQKNIMAIRKILWRNNVIVTSEDTGENYNRTVELHMSDGRVTVRSGRGPVKEL